ncbi:MAG: hypothetical protein Q9200_001011 [Gallowayella weberi]
MTDHNNEDMPTKEELAELKEEVERSRFWADFMTEVEKMPMVSHPVPGARSRGRLKRNRTTCLSDSKRMLRGWDAERRKAQGLQPRSDEEIEEELGSGMGFIAEQIQDVVMRYDAQKRKEKGLEPRSWREFMEEFEEAVDRLVEDGSDESALARMASLSLGKMSEPE